MRRSAVALVASLLLCGPRALAQEPASAPASLPVREVTVFKDGHAFVMRRGEVATDAAGDVVLDELPIPVLGTFWPFAPAGGPKLVGVTAGRQRVRVERTALDVIDLLRANVGAKVGIVEKPVGDREPDRYEGTVLGFPERTVREMESTDPPTPEPRSPQRGNVVLLRTVEGVRAVPLDRIGEVTFADEPRPRVTSEEIRPTLRLDLDWGGAAPAARAEVGVAYLQKGLRWIPSYRVEIDGAGKAVVRLQATLVNDLTDLTGATVHLVIGVPTFEFSSMTDPISLQRALVSMGRQQMRDFLSNAIMSQAAAPMEGMTIVEEPELGEAATAGEQREDLFSFTLNDVSLRRGERMVVPVAETTVAYEDVYVVDVPMAPPPEVREIARDDQARAHIRELLTPHAKHVLRITNSGDAPLTTAPALVFANGRVLAQGLMTYTARGAKVDLPVTTAVNLDVRRSEKETGRTPNAVKLRNDQFHRVDLEGAITLTSRLDRAVDVEVARHVIGGVDSADHDGDVAMVNLHEEPAAAASHPDWMSSWDWPWWWHRLNGIGRIRWRLRLEPGQTVALGYRWHYLWQ